MAAFNNQSFFQQDRPQLIHTRTTTEFGQFRHDKPWNFANWPAEFCKTFRSKLWALVIGLGLYVVLSLKTGS